MNFSGSLMLQSILFFVQDKESNPNIVTTVSNDTQCFGMYGCYSIGPPFLAEHRPIQYYPLPPDDLHVRFPTFTRNNIKIPYFLDPNEPEKIKQGQFNPTGPFIFLAHGYLEGGNKPWIQALAEALLSIDQNENGTVIAVDWREASSPPYAQAAANIRLLGTMTAHMIYDMLVVMNLKNLDNFHFIGHSLGAHLGGYTGQALIKEFDLKIGRITGMDPADPFFGHCDDSVRLDRSDAKYVDIIHTDALPFISGGLGITEAIGHVDFYPNGGNNQPGCSHGMMQYITAKQGSVFEGLHQFLGCNHIRSYEFLTESIGSNCPFLAISCPTFEDFARGACFECGVNGQHCLRFGYHSNLGYEKLKKSGLVNDNTSLVAYFKTGDEDPFCRMHYRVTVNISNSEESSSHGGDIGHLWMILINKDGSRSNKIPLEEHGGYHRPGTQWTLMVSASDIGKAESAEVICEYETNLLNPLTWRILSSPQIFLSWIYIESLEHKNSIIICPPDDKPVVANIPSHFKQNYCKNIMPIKVSTIAISPQVA